MAKNEEHAFGKCLLSADVISLSTNLAFSGSMLLFVLIGVCLRCYLIEFGRFIE